MRSGTDTRQSPAEFGIRKISSWLFAGVMINADDKCDGPGAMAAKEAEIPEKLASRPHKRITLNYVGFLWIQGN